jgi:predicted MPP superfamily phosphohydrolase
MFFLPSLLIALTCLTVMHRWAARSFGPVARKQRALAAALGAFLAVEMVAGWAARQWHGSTVESLHTVCSVVMMTLEIASLPILVVQAATWLLARLAIRVSRSRTLSPAPAPAPVTAPSVSRRQVIEGVAGIGAIGASGAMLGWGAVYGRHAYETCEVPIRIAGLPRALDGYVIAQISDLHVGVHVSEDDIAVGLDLVRRARPDLVVVTGDIVDHDPRLAPSIARKLADLPSRDGVVAILGNHDLYAGADAVTAALRAAGVSPLVNDGRIIRPGDGGGFALLGVDDKLAHRYGRRGPDLDRAIAAVATDAPRILLSHQPSTVDEWAGRVALQLSGHTHGGQVNPGFRPADLFFRYVAGRYDVGGTTLYVNRGFGTVGPPARIGAPPEVTRIVLVAA